MQIPIPSESEVSDLVAVGEKQLRTRIGDRSALVIQSFALFPLDSTLISLVFTAESAKRIPDVENISGHKGTELSRTPVEIKSGDWSLKVVPWIGGRIISMEHLPSSNAHILCSCRSSVH